MERCDLQVLKTEDPSKYMLKNSQACVRKMHAGCWLKPVFCPWCNFYSEDTSYVTCKFARILLGAHYNKHGN